MALSFAVQHSYVIGDRHQVIVDITGDTSYPTGGWALDFTAAPFSFNRVDNVNAQVPISGVRTYQYDYANKKLKGFSAYNTQVTNATDCSADTFRVVVTGKGFGN